VQSSANQRHAGKWREPCPTTSRGGGMDTFFVRKQIIAGAILFACLELGVVVIRLLAR
jgi:hypothetical protein